MSVCGARKFFRFSLKFRPRHPLLPRFISPCERSATRPYKITTKKDLRLILKSFCFKFYKTYFIASSIATAQATVIPTMGLLPLTMNSPFFFCISFFAQKKVFFGGFRLPVALCGSICCRKKVEKIFFLHSEKSYAEKTLSYRFFNRFVSLISPTNKIRNNTD